jgi:hypothetical protein
MVRAVLAGAIALAVACGGVQQRFPDDVAASIAHHDMRRLETERFIIYYPASRRAQVDRFIARATRCADSIRAQAIVHERAWREKMIIVMPEVAFNNAFVLSELAGYEHVSVIPTFNTLDFTTEFGLAPDPGFIACHELVHYVHFEQIDGFWDHANELFGHLYSPQIGYDPWFLEGLATHYEAKQAAGAGRPNWPIFTGMFAAAYAGKHVRGGDMSSLGREAPVGHHYLVGTMFVKFLTERYGERPIWIAIADQARAITGMFFTGTFKNGFGVSFGDLLDEFDAWSARTFPVRTRPPAQATLAVAGNDARYARGRDGTEAWVANDVDVPPHLVVRDPSGATLADLGLIDMVPPRTLVSGDPLLVSGLSITDAGDVWLTMIDLDATYQIPRLLRWRRGARRLEEVAHDLGPGATIDPTGGIYYYCAVDGDRWSLASWNVRTGARKTLVSMPPGTYVLGARASRDGTQLVADVWDGSAFVAWRLDAASGAKLGEVRGPNGSPIWDASFTDDGRVIYLGVVAGRFQVLDNGNAITDAPYAVLGAREAHGTIRFLNRDGWQWTVDEVALPAAAPATPYDEAAPVAASRGLTVPAIVSDEPASAWDHFFFPQLRSPTVILVSSSVPHIGLVLGGGDRLGQQRWSIAGYVQPRNSGNNTLHWGGDIAYLNTMLAPYSILATGSWIDWVDPVSTDDPNVTLAGDRRTRDAALTIARTWRETLTTAVSAVYTDDFDRPPMDVGLRRYLGGPALTLSWVSGDSTLYTGLRRALLATTSTAFYPKELSSFAGTIYDLGGSVGAVIPLPFGRRHTLTVSVRERALIARDDTGLLQLGGDSGFGILYNRSSISETPPAFDDLRFPPKLRFIEPLRGYEDYAITTDRATVADASWRYPLIIDKGVAATLWVLPASFVRELDFELFASGAVDRHHDQHAAVGGAVELRINLFRLPLLVIYQIARRVRDDDALTQLVGIGPDL